MTSQDKKTVRADVKDLFRECLKHATKEQKEKAYIAATSFLMGCQSKAGRPKKSA